MKHRHTIVVLLAIFSIGTSALNAQNVKRDTIILSSDHDHQAPQFKGGNEELANFLKKNLKYPELAERYGVEGTVTMTFIVDKEGALKNINAKECKIERFNTTKFSRETESRQKELKEQFSLLFAKEAARVIRKMPKWTPARLDGKKINCQFSQRITFRVPSK